MVRVVGFDRHQQFYVDNHKHTQAALNKVLKEKRELIEELEYLRGTSDTMCPKNNPNHWRCDCGTD